MATPIRQPEDPNLSLAPDSRIRNLRTAPNPTIIVVAGAAPNPYKAVAFRGARVQFQNNDNQGYRLQVTGIVTLDSYLPAFGTLTVFVNERADVPSEIDYTLTVEEMPADYPVHLVKELNTQSAISSFAGSDMLPAVRDFAKSTFGVSDELAVEPDVASVSDAQVAADVSHNTVAFASITGPGGKIIVKG